MVDIRPATPADLAGLPALEVRADRLFETLGIGPLPGPGSVEELARALVVLVAGDPPRGFARIDDLAGAAHLEQLAVDPDHMHHGLGRALLRAACTWAGQHGYDELTLATYRDVAWNGPFYASEGFSEWGPVDDFYAARGSSLKKTVMGRFGARVLMRRSV